MSKDTLTIMSYNTNTHVLKDLIEKSILKVDNWVIANDYKGYEPFDGLTSYIRPLTFYNVFLEQLLQQNIRQSPFNLRPLLGVKPLDSTKGRGFMAWGYLKLFENTHKDEYRQKSVQCLDWLIQNKSPLYEKYSWGNHFDYSSRSGNMPRYTSTIVWTSLIGQAFLDAYILLKDKNYLDIAVSICEWIIDLPRQTEDGTCLSYVADREPNSIHNSNMLGAAMLARTAKFTGNIEYLKVAKEAMSYSCADQLQDGAWYYGKASKYHWIDNFHTGYNLDSLKCYIEFSNDKTFEENLHRGYRYFTDHFIEESGRPRYYHDRTYPIDIQCASQAIDTLVYFSDIYPASLGMALKVAKWTIENMQDEMGFFYYRILPLKKVKIPMIHWGQATMFKSLSHLLLKMKQQGLT